MSSPHEQHAQQDSLPDGSVGAQQVHDRHAEHDQPPRSFWQRARVPLLLFVLTCWTTYTVGQREHVVGNGLLYASSLMTILLCHEFGHYVQARRYGVPASLPYFIPVPFEPLGTMGAVILMRGNMGNRRALFDIGITGPLAGLVPAIAFSIIGLQRSNIVDLALPMKDELMIGFPPLFHFLSDWLIGPLAPAKTIEVHPLAYAGWVGIFITALNLFPIGQLDGGHVLYALLRRKAHAIATLLLMGAIFGVVVTQNYSWLPMLLLLTLVGPNHPPTGDDEMPLGTGRIILGWATLAFVIIGFTPRPFMIAG